MVVARDGRLTEVNLVSAEEARARQIEQQRQREEQARLARELQQRRQLEGERVMAEKLADPVFMALSAGQQVAYWDVFRRQYPEVHVERIYADAYGRYQGDLEQARLRQQVADAEQRAAAAEARAQQAEQAANNVQYNSYVAYVAVPWAYDPFVFPQHRTSCAEPRRFPAQYGGFPMRDSGMKHVRLPNFASVPLSVRGSRLGLAVAYGEGHRHTSAMDEGGGAAYRRRR